MMMMMMMMMMMIDDDDADDDGGGDGDVDGGGDGDGDVDGDGDDDDDDDGGPNGICLTSVTTSCEERLVAYYYASRQGLTFCIALMCRFWILIIWGSVRIEETVVGYRNLLRMKTSAY